MKGKKRFYSKKGNQNWQKKEEEEIKKIIQKIKEEARKEKIKREKRELVKRIKERWEWFLTERKRGREIKKKEKEHEKERRKRILPDEGFGD